jgi:N-glycosylase/DNA lyase
MTWAILERTKLIFIDTCRNLVELGQLSQRRVLEICDLLDRLEEYDNEQFKAELSRISKGLSDLIG